MENILKELTSIDMRAKRIIAEAEAEFNNLDNIMQVKKDEILREVETNISVKIKQLRSDSENYINLKKTEIDEEVKTQLNELESKWEINLPKWQDELFNACINKGE